MAFEETLLESEEKMQKSEEHVLHEFAGVRTGKASPALLENVKVDVYGSEMRIKDIATITVPEMRQLVVQPWDETNLPSIDKAIQKANLGLNPAVQGKMLRISIPQLNGEQRQHFVKAVKGMAEQGRISIRQHRREALEAMKKEAKDDRVSEDELKHSEGEVQKLTDKFIKIIDEHVVTKEEEILKV
ncbi:MAG: ribosome recycling factor [Verrucomicrobiia bacterium]|jgi:ribosome recycling factor